MAAVKARRPRGGGEPPKRGRRYAPSPSGDMPRLARIKLASGWASDNSEVSGRSLMLGLAGIVMFCGAAVAGAAWLGSSLFDAREAFERTADATAANIGFAVGDITVTGISGARAQEVREIVIPEGRRSMLSLDPDAVKARVESLDWVASARVRRLWPSTLAIEVERRQAYARWQEDGEVSVIDYNGERLLTERAADHSDLPLVVGRGAGPAAEPLLITLEDLPQLRARLDALVRVGERRWNLKLKSGAIIALPEDNPGRALEQLELLQTQHALLDRPVTAFDMRAPGRLAVRVHPELDGGRRALLGGA